MIDITAFIGCSILIFLLFYLGDRKDKIIPEFRLSAGTLLVLFGALLLIYGIGDLTTVTITQMETNSTNITISNITRIETSSNTLNSDLTRGFGFIYLFLGLYLVVAQGINYLRET